MPAPCLFTYTDPLRERNSRSGVANLGHATSPILIYLSTQATRVALFTSNSASCQWHGRVSGELTQENWQFSITARQIHAAQLSQYLAQTFHSSLAAFDISGLLDMRLDVSGQSGRLSQATLQGIVSDVAFSDAPGTYAGEELHTEFTRQAVRKAVDPSSFQLHFDILLQQGQMYLEPIFVEVLQEPITVVGESVWQPSTGSLRIPHFLFTHPEVIQIQGTLHPDLNSVSAGQAPQNFMRLLEDPSQLPLHAFHIAV